MIESERLETDVRSLENDGGVQALLFLPEHRS
jgi:hypothetical protein